MSDRAPGSEYLILGAGLAGLAAASVLGERATVLEREQRPGGLVRTAHWNGYWFDHVVHLLHFYDEATEARVRELFGPVLVRCPPRAYAESLGGVTQYPFQMNLRGLGADDVVRCVTDLAATTFGRETHRAENFEQELLLTFGRRMCELFLFPYNEKVWKRPLASLAPSAFQWTVTPPDFASVVRGAIDRESDFAPYNANGWYPRPPRGSVQRGMELLTHALTRRVADLRLGWNVEQIDLEARTVRARRSCEEALFEYETACSTLPLPHAIAACVQAPAELKRACAGLLVNRALTVTVSVRGPRPAAGHWRYYADPALSFNRIIFLHEFDPELAPPDGWGALVEVTEPAEVPLGDMNALMRRVVEDLQRCGALNGGEVIDTHVIVADPAYVVFTAEGEEVVARAMAFLREHGVEPLGRYGRWEYSSMSQVMKAAFAWADAQPVLRR